MDIQLKNLVNYLSSNNVGAEEGVVYVMNVKVATKGGSITLSVSGFEMSLPRTVDIETLAHEINSMNVHA